MPAEKLCFLQLLKGVNKFVIPKIQRDYAQGRLDRQNATFYSEIRGSFITSLYDALTSDTELVLDYVYGSNDESNFFYPIDGQQRLTTLFLLHWYLGMREHRLDADTKQTLKKFSYETRDTTIEFCASLIEIDIDIANTTSLSQQIRDSHIYHSAFDWDPTVDSMLNMLDDIHKKFSDEPPLWDRLDKITFWALRLEDFGLTDDLFVKMNARGERLSKFDTFKSDLESALEKRFEKENNNKKLKHAIKTWKINIDNEYLDNFWKYFELDLVERNLFRLIMFYAKCHNVAKKDVIYTENWEISDKDTSYRDELLSVAEDENELLEICQLLKRFCQWKDLAPCVNDLLISDKDKVATIPFQVKVKLFALLYWWANVDDNRVAKDFAEFFRVVSNYVHNIRRYDAKPRQFRSVIYASDFKTRITLVMDIVNSFTKTQDDFVTFILNSKYKELEYEREKFAYADLNKIKTLEEIPTLNRLTQNFFFNNQLYVDAEELNAILNDKSLKNKYLRIVLSFADKKYGYFSDLVFDETHNDTGLRIMYYDWAEIDQVAGRCHKCFLQGSSTFGEKFLTAPPAEISKTLNDLSAAIRKFSVAFYEKRHSSKLSVAEALDEVLIERLATECDFTDKSSILWYIIKYDDSFFYDLDYTTFLVRRRKNYAGYDEDNVYHIQCTNADYDMNVKHYNPFYLALCRVLKKRNCPVTIDENKLYIYDNKIEDAYPCTLSNEWRVQILENGDWKITFNGNLPKNSQGISGLSSDEYILKNNGVDCIEAIATFIQNHGA